MDYKEATRLAENGFPLTGWYPAISKKEEEKPRHRQPFWFKGHPYFVPTLEEVIEACGEEFGVLEQFTNGSGWGAYIPNDIGTNGLGKTPLEAVANLYLKLHHVQNHPNS